jgi:hypothetical protein
MRIMALAGRMTAVHKRYPDEFRRDVVAVVVARKGEQTPRNSWPGGRDDLRTITDSRASP